MIYFDNAANSIVDKRVLDDFVKVTEEYTANPNSTHILGAQAKSVIDKSSINIAKFFNTNKDNIIYTSGSSEANNLVIKGVYEAKKNIGNHIIISSLEHSSIVAPANYLADNGAEVSVIDVKSDGSVDIDKLKELITDKTILISISSVDSELGTIINLEEVKELVKDYPNITLHTDATQAIGKVKIDFDGFDLITFAPHKFYGLNGCGVLVNKGNVSLIPLIHGGKSTTIYRSGTPVPALISSISTALDLAIANLYDRIEYVGKLKSYLIQELSKLDYVHINTISNSIVHTLNFSLIGYKAKDVIESLSNEGICVSSASACSMGGPSRSVLALTKDINLASNTIRISLSHTNTIEEINIFLDKFKEIINNL